MYVHVRDSSGNENYITEASLEAAIAAGDVVAFRRSDGWITVPEDSHRGHSVSITNYSGQERRRTLLSRKKIFTES